MHSAFLLLTLTCPAVEPIPAPAAAPVPMVISSGPSSDCGCSSANVWGPTVRHRRFGGRLGMKRHRAISSDCGCASHDGGLPVPVPLPIPAGGSPAPAAPATTSLPDAGYRPLPMATGIPTLQTEPPLPVAN